MDRFKKGFDRLTSSFVLTTVVCVLMLVTAFGFVWWGFASLNYGGVRNVAAGMVIGGLAGSVTALAAGAFMRAWEKRRK